MIDPISLAYLFLKPNREREKWSRTQAAWRALLERLEIEAEDGRDDTWPVTKRELGTIDGNTVRIGIQYLEMTDPFPLDRLTCDIGPASRLSSFSFRRVTTGDASFDEKITARSDTEELARELLTDEFRGALRRIEQDFHFRYERGHAKLSWGTETLDPEHLQALLDAIVTACRRTASVPYR
jgi:hypothetical protein